MSQVEDSNRIVLSAEMQALDRWTIQNVGVSTTALMETAGRAVANHVRGDYGLDSEILILFGRGHNGADALVVGRTLKEWGFNVRLRSPFEEVQLCELCRHQLNSCLRLGLNVQLSAEPNANELLEMVVVDGLFGTGLSRTVTGVSKRWIDAVNAAECQVVSIDIASGVCGTSGSIMGCAVRASSTVTFQYSKWGHWGFPGADYRGRLSVVDIGISQSGFESCELEDRFVLGADWPRCILSVRHRNAHKGHFGHLGVIGGHQGMVGAAKLAALAGMRAGAGKSTILCEHAVFGPLSLELETVMCALEPAVDPNHGGFDAAEWTPSHTAYVVGCGLDPNRLGARFRRVVESGQPMVLDAGALIWLSRNPTVQLCNETVITPHPKEAAALLGINVAAVEADRLGALKRLSERYQCTVVLKGGYTLVCQPNSAIYLCQDGNPGMASAGMGDVLAGVIGGLMSQGVSSWDAARAGVTWHARAGDATAQVRGEVPMIATDLIENLSVVLSC